MRGLRQMISEALRGDVIVCRDQSRLGRDAIEVTLVVRDLVRDRGCHLFYDVTGQEIQLLVPAPSPNGTRPSVMGADLLRRRKPDRFREVGFGDAVRIDRVRVAFAV